jgi:hypothetical protein
MEHAVERSIRRYLFRDIALDEPKTGIAREVFQVLRTSRQKVVETNDLVAFV